MTLVGILRAGYGRLINVQHSSVTRVSRSMQREMASQLSSVCLISLYLMSSKQFTLNSNLNRCEHGNTRHLGIICWHFVLHMQHTELQNH